MDVLQVQNLNAGYLFKKKKIWAVRNVSLNVGKEDFLGIAGESGCGKTTLVMAILRLLKSPGFVESGKVIFDGVDLYQLSNEELNQLRWKQFSYVPQSSMNSLNPVLSVRDQMLDVVFRHTSMTRQEALQLILDMLQLVGIPPERVKSYPHQLSGGMRQRVVIAMSLLLSPKLVIFDEPTTALDVVVQRSIIEKIFELQLQKRFSAIFVTHDISLLFEITKHLAIMYAGEIVEYGPTREVYEGPLHPYTIGLIESLPSIYGELKEYKSIPGRLPDLSQTIVGCSFYERCRSRMDVCRLEHPGLKEVKPGRWVACHLY